MTNNFAIPRLYAEQLLSTRIHLSGCGLLYAAGCILPASSQNNKVVCCIMDENVKLTSQDRLDAICWAANEAGQSYGKFAATLTQAEKEAIYERYQSLLEKNAKAEKKRLETARRQQSIDPASAHKRRAGS